MKNRIRKRWSKGAAALLAAALLAGIALPPPAQAETRFPADMDAADLLRLNEAITAASGADGGMPIEASAVLPAQGQLELISESAAGHAGDSSSPSVSEDGRFVAFDSASAGIVEGDDNGFADVFLLDRETNAATMISRTDYGTAPSYDPVISMDGSYVLFASEAWNLVEEHDWDETINLYLYDRQSSTRQMVAKGVSPGKNKYAVSANGQFITFWSRADNGVKDDFNNNWDLFRKDVSTGRTVRITSHPYSAAEPAEQTMYSVSMSPDGNHIAFDSPQANLVEGDTNDAIDVFVYDYQSSAVERVSVSSSGGQGNAGSGSPSISADGRYVAYSSEASNLAEQSGGAFGIEIFVHDRKTKETKLIPSLPETEGEFKQAPAISAEGRLLTYEARQAGLQQIYVHDRTSGVTRLLSAGLTGDGGNADSMESFITNNGRYAMFASRSVNLSNHEDTEDMDVFLAELEGLPAAESPKWPESANVQVEQAGGSYAALSWTPVAGGDGSTIYKVMTVHDGYRRIAAITRSASALVRDLELAEPYTFEVAAGSESYVFGEKSLTVSTNTLLPETTPPGKPVHLNVTPVQGRLLVSWTDPPDLDLTGIILQWKKAEAAAYKEVFVLPGQQSQVLEGITNSRIYDVRVMAVDAEGNRSEGTHAQAKSMDGRVLERISVTETGEQLSPRTNENEQPRPASVDVSADGRYFVFSGRAHNLIPDADWGTAKQIYLYDRQTSALKVISRDRDGYLGFDDSWSPRISGNGRFIVYVTDASNLAGLIDSNLYGGIVLYDRDSDGNGIFDEQEGTAAELISPFTYWQDPEQLSFAEPAISDDGGKVAFRSAGEGGSESSLYVYDRSKSESGEEEGPLADPISKLALPQGSYSSPAMSANGEYLAVQTTAALDPNDTDGYNDVYVIRLSDLQAELASAIEGEMEGAMAQAAEPSISDDGQLVAFAYNEDEQTQRYGVYLYDLRTDEARSIAYSALGHSEHPALSGDGTVIAYTGYASDSPGFGTHVFAYDIPTGESSVISKSAEGSYGSGSSHHPALSSDGRIAAFVSSGDNLAAGDTNFTDDVFYTELKSSAAADTEPPVWPDGAEAAASGPTHQSVTISWPPASDQRGVVSYQIFNGNELAATASSSELSRAISGLQPETDYTFRIIAIDAAGNRSEALSVSVITGKAPEGGELALFDAKASAPVKYGSYAQIGDLLTVAFKGTAGYQASAVVHAVLEDGTAVEEAVDVTEQAASHYSGSFELKEGISEITGVEVRLTDGNRHKVQEAVMKTKVRVGGTVQILLAGEQPEWMDQGTLILSSQDRDRMAQAAIKLDGRDSYELRGLPAGPEGSGYRIVVKTASGEPVELVADQMTVHAGKRSAFTLEAKPIASLEGLLFAVGQSEAAAFVTAFVGGDMVYSSYGLTVNGGERYRIGGLHVGEEVTINVYPRSAELKQLQVTKVVEKPGSNVFDIELPERSRAVLRGQVVNQDGVPLRGAAVTAVQYGEAGYETRQAVTDVNGMYAMELYEGAARMTARYDYSTSSTEEVRLAAGQQNNHDIRMSVNVLPTVQLDVYTKHLDGDWVGPLSLDWRVLAHFGYRASLPERSQSGNLLTFFGKPGETVRICMNGRESGLPAACGSAILDERDISRIELRMEQRGAQASGRIETLGSIDRAQASIYKVDSEGKLSFVEERSIGLQFALSIDEPGQYQVVFSSSHYGMRSAVRGFEIAVGEVLNLGTIRLTSPGPYGGQAGNAITLASSEALPGELLQVRTSYVNRSSWTTENTRLVVPVPSGTELAPNSVTVNGMAAAAEMKDDHSFEIDLGDVASGKGGTAAYHLKIAEDYEGERISVTQHIRYRLEESEEDEWFGEAAAAVTRLRLDAPPVTGYRDPLISGIGPAGSIVRVFDGERPLGETVVTAGGLWRLRIHLTDAERKSAHRLRAEAELGARRWYTEESAVIFEHNYPEVTEVRMNQAGGRMVHIDPSQGVAVFPYVSSLQPFTVTLKFQEDERVRNVRAKIGNKEVQMSRSPDATYRAVISPTVLGPVYVRYDVRRGLEFDETSVQEEQLGNLPDAFEKMEETEVDVEQSPDNPLRMKASVGGTFLAKGEKVTMRSTVSYEPVNYVTTARDDVLLASTGLKLMGYSFDYAFSGNTFTYSISGYISEEDFMKAGGDKALQQLAAVSGSGEPMKGAVSTAAVNVRSIKINYRGTMEFAEKNFDRYEFYDDVKDTVENTDKLKQLEDVLGMIEAGCAPAAANQYRDWTDRIADRYMAQEAAKWAMIASSILFAPTTLGGSILVFFISEQIEDVMDDSIDSEIKDLKRHIAQDDRCEEEPEEKRKKVGDPKWIYDPSGYVYEVEPNNRMEGVTATALFWEESEQAWKPWDADWYGQQNPHLTDINGKYGWDVPEGKWKVVYAKEGYEPAESRELLVLPPHTDVNVAMESVLPPRALYAMAVSEGEAVDIVFDRHVDETTLSRLMLSATVQDESGEPAEIEGAIAAVDPVEYKGLKVSKRFRFTPAAALAPGQSVQIRIYAGAQSYNGIPMTEDSVLNVQMEDLPPGMAANAEADATANGVTITWTDPTDLDFDRVEVAWRSAGGTDDYSEPLVIQKGGGIAVIDGWTPGASYDVAVITVDAGGNRTKHQLTVTTPFLEPEPDLVPTRPVMNAAAEAQGTSLNVSWTDPAFAEDLVKVTLEWMKAGAEVSAGTMEVEPGVQKAVITGLAPDTSYDIIVKAWDEAGNPSTGFLLTERTGTAPPTGGGGDPGGTPGAPPPERSDETKIVVAPQGGLFEGFDGRLKLDIAEGAFPNGAHLQLRLDESVQPPDEEGWRLLSPAYRIQEESGQLPRKPILLTISDQALVRNDVKPNSMGVYRRNPQQPDQWEYMGGKIAAGGAAIEAYIDSPGTYAVLAYGHSFDDLNGHWSKPEVEALISRHIVNGVSSNLFAPERAVTRAEMVKMLITAIPSYMELPANEPALRYKDVAADAWYDELVHEATRLGLIRGNQGLFRPNDPITREEMAVLAMRFAELLGKSAKADEQSLERYADNGDISPWAAEAIAFATEAGLMRGVQEDRIVPNGTTTRAQAAAVLYRMLVFMEWI
ncbi:hypothetical protein D3P08_25490 [Paenibacillus nanensis]|uniref:Uncharacterized protein n=1 Tax=Paenibacillus nanensis TaxID=393251 RepID=A0A3A1UP18_9BACL|nr:S-layer homology domain-containing protein [Paenibacillus nanensis]RIX47266.1 hypothetical protein D3P08_25490 [Paenibacillus nanensis]